MNFLFRHLLLGAILLCISNSQAASAYKGYNFYASGTKCYLKDMDGNTIHTWTSKYQVMSHAYLLRDSSVLFPCSDNADNGDGKFQSNIALQGGRFQIIKWDGTVAWDFSYHGKSYMPHHDCTFYYTKTDIKELPTIFTIAATVESDGTIAEKIVELKPTGATTADIIWEWRAFEHATTSGNNKPELLDIKLGYATGGGGGFNSKEWLHANHVRFNPQSNQLVISLKYFNELIVIDHSTTKEEAAGHTKGKYGKGGDILYRWGNPSNYGCPGTKHLSQQHAAAWIPQYFPGTKKLLPGAGNIMVISNGNKIGYEIVLPAVNGVYSRTNNAAYDPSTPLRSISITNMSGNEGSITRLPNGNTLVCKGMMSNSAAEYDSTGASVWTMAASGATELFRIDSSYLGSTLIDTGSGTTEVHYQNCSYNHSPQKQLSCMVHNGAVHLSVKNSSHPTAQLTVVSPTGKTILKTVIDTKEFVWKPLKCATGLYVVTMKTGDQILCGNFFYAQ